MSPMNGTPGGVHPVYPCLLVARLKPPQKCGQTSGAATNTTGPPQGGVFLQNEWQKRHMWADLEPF